MSAACETAASTIDFEQYVVRDDTVGLGFLRLLAVKARDGIRVRIILDAFGSRMVKSHPVMQELRTAGVQIAYYHGLRPPDFLRPRSWFPRTHAKLLHIDADCTFVGSMCLAAYMITWRDTMIRLPDQLNHAARADFQALWNDIGDGVVDGDPGATEAGGPSATYAAQNPLGGNFPIREALLAAVAVAKSSICLATPYFFPPPELESALQQAGRRGVKITLLLSRLTDVAVADRMTAALLSRWQRCGFRVYLYEQGVMHAKYAVIDDDWATVGSCNFDCLGLGYNREVNIILRYPSVVAQLRGNFDEDIGHASLTRISDRRMKLWFERLIGGVCFALMRLVLR
ncbi:MAG TPA: phosphatidylserine/phosphatidylglycerophosphate/cardiolipin synthase family protein [Asticcacaulis sp.]|nr:phosphatidylserine/phosphatidylglycerophosphate/cardiolipin synthase family protein [Asticcacaulis sp.]